MTGPEPKHPSESVDFDEIAAQLKASAAKGPDLNEVKLDGDEVPEALRGKSAADLLKHVDGLSQALKISEDARKETADKVTEISARLAASQIAGAAAAPLTEEEKVPTLEEITAAFQEDPMKAMTMMEERTEKRLTQNLDQRIRPLTAGSAMTAESRAKERYTEDFALLNKEIDDVLTRQGLTRQALTTDNHWDDLIAYVRGRNMDRIIDHRAGKAAEVARKAAEEAAAMSTGFSGTAAAGRPPASAPAGDLDETQKEIIRVMRSSGIDIDEKSYAKWSKVG